MEVEQAQFSRKLHDRLGQNVTALLLGLTGLERELDGQSGAKLTVQSLHSITQDLGQELHDLALELRPSSLDDHGLARVLAPFLDEWSLVQKVRVDYDCVSLGESRLPPGSESVLFRVIRHALHYIAKTALTEHLSVVLQRNGEGVAFIIENTGKLLAGSRPEGPAPDWHLRTMKAWLLLVGGTLALEPRLPHGVAIFVRLPLKTGTRS